MAILKPSNISPNNISQDADHDIVVSWVNNGDRQYHYQVVIYRNTDNVLIYDTTKLTSFNTYHTVPSSTLTNGVVYKYQITVWNEINEFANSNWVIFKCSSTPIISFTNVTLGDEILNDHYLFEGEYTQTEVVAIKSWQMLLYDSFDNLIGNSGLVFNEDIEYQFTGFNTDSNYSIELQATSQDDLIATTGKISFSVRYEVPSVYVDLVIENVRKKAGIRLQWSLIEIIGDGENYSFIGDEKVDVTNGKVWFSQGFNVDDDFTAKLWIESVTNTIFNINKTASITGFATAIADTTILWFEDANKLVETNMIVELSDSEPSDTDALWVYDENQATIRSLGVSVDIEEPNDEDTLWLDLIVDIEDIEILKMMNDDGDIISLRYFDGAFHLYKNNEFVDSSSSDGANYYIYIQQIGSSLVLHSEVII